MKCYVDLQLSTKVCHIFPFSSFSFFFLTASFHFFPRHHPPPPNHSILQNIYPWILCFKVTFGHLESLKFKGLLVAQNQIISAIESASQKTYKEVVEGQLVAQNSNRFGLRKTIQV